MSVTVLPFVVKSKRSKFPNTAVTLALSAEKTLSNVKLSVFGNANHAKKLLPEELGLLAQLLPPLFAAQSVVCVK